MPVVQTRCLKCGAVSLPIRTGVAFCQNCFADESYLKPIVLPDPPSSERPTVISER